MDVKGSCVQNRAKILFGKVLKALYSGILVSSRWTHHLQQLVAVGYMAILYLSALSVSLCTTEHKR
jgi:hypothetical protein